MAKDLIEKMGKREVGVEDRRKADRKLVVEMVR
jgi:hypothetical protein